MLHKLKMVILLASNLKTKKLSAITLKEKSDFTFACIESMQALGVPAQQVLAAVHSTYEQESPDAA